MKRSGPLGHAEGPLRVTHPRQLPPDRVAAGVSGHRGLDLLGLVTPERVPPAYQLMRNWPFSFVPSSVNIPT